jgi:hypothetical protein
MDILRLGVTVINPENGHDSLIFAWLFEHIVLHDRLCLDVFVLGYFLYQGF